MTMSTIIDTEDGDSLTFTISFVPSTDERFWPKMAERAAALDDENNGQHQAAYTRRESWAVLFLHDGFESIDKINQELGVHLGGWTFDENIFGRESITWVDADGE